MVLQIDPHNRKEDAIPNAIKDVTGKCIYPHHPLQDLANLIYHTPTPSLPVAVLPMINHHHLHKF
jgi:hypothetical protein